MDPTGFKIPEINNNDLIPTSVELQNMKDKAIAENEQRATRRFIITTVIGAIAAVASVVAATAGIIALLT